MNEFQVVEAKDLDGNPFNMIGKDWMLITAENEGRVNTMTASWGGMGVLWGHNVVYIFVRRSRYTKEFIDAAELFSLTFYDTNQYRKTLSYLGSLSGRDADKIKESGLTVAHKDGVPFFEEAKTVLLCKKLSKHFISPEGMIDESILERWYGDEDYHDMYVGEIDQILVEK